MNWRDLVLVAVGGGVGSSLRYLVGKAMGSQADVVFPWHTLAVNLSGAFLIGVLIVAAARQGWPGWWRPLIAVGVLGGYTTFSTFSLDTYRLLEEGHPGQAALNAFGTLAAGLVAVWLGLRAGQAV
jgi:CrcB protein